MSKLIESFETTAGTTVKKVEASNGRIMRFADGTPVSAKAYGGYARHKSEPADSGGSGTGTADTGYNFISGGRMVEIPVPEYDENGEYDGYTRVEVDADADGSRYGQSVALTQKGAKERPPETTVIDGERYETDDLARAADDARDAGLDIMDYRN